MDYKDGIDKDYYIKFLESRIDKVEMEGQKLLLEVKNALEESNKEVEILKTELKLEKINNVKWVD